MMTDLLIVSALVILLTLPYTIPLGIVLYHCFKGMWGTHWSKGRDPSQYGWIFDDGFEFRGDDFLTKENLDNDVPEEVKEQFLLGQYALLEFDVFLMDYAHKFKQ